MLGSQSNGSAAVRSNSITAAGVALLINVAVGAAAGLLVSTLRLRLGLPGHRALLWLTPLIVARVLSRHPVGATASASSVALTAVLLRARLASDMSFLILTPAAGLIIDGAVDFAERRKLSAPWLFPLLISAGLAANIVCATKAWITPVLIHGPFLGLQGQAGYLLSYAVFGAAAGFAGAGVPTALRIVRTHACKIAHRREQT